MRSEATRRIFLKGLLNLIPFIASIPVVSSCKEFKKKALYGGKIDGEEVVLYTTIPYGGGKLHTILEIKKSDKTIRIKDVAPFYQPITQSFLESIIIGDHEGDLYTINGAAYNIRGIVSRDPLTATFTERKVVEDKLRTATNLFQTYILKIRADLEKQQ